MYKFSKKLSLATLALTLATNLAQATVPGREISGPLTPLPSEHLNGGEGRDKHAPDRPGWSQPGNERGEGIGGRNVFNPDGTATKTRASSSHKFWIHENHKQNFYEQWAGDLGVRGSYNIGNFRKFQNQLRRCASEYATVSFQRPIGPDDLPYSLGQTGLTDESVFVYYNLPRNLCWKVNRKGRILEMHRLQPEELGKLVRDLMGDRDPRAIIDQLKIVRYLAPQDQRRVCDHVGSRLDNSDWIQQNDFHRFFSREQVGRLNDCVRRLRGAEDPERSRICDEIDDICKAGRLRTDPMPVTQGGSLSPSSGNQSADF
jgi:hypothetical protein